MKVGSVVRVRQDPDAVCAVGLIESVVDLPGRPLPLMVRVRWLGTGMLLSMFAHHLEEIT